MCLVYLVCAIYPYNMNWIRELYPIYHCKFTDAEQSSYYQFKKDTKINAVWYRYNDVTLCGNAALNRSIHIHAATKSDSHF